MALQTTSTPASWIRMLSLSLLLTTTSLASDLAPAGTFATQGQATAVVPASKQTNAIDSVLAANAKSDIPTSILSTVVVTVKATPTPDLKPAFESPAIAAPALSPTQTHLVAVAQATDSSQLNGPPFTDDESSTSDGPEDPGPYVKPFPLPGGGHGPVVPSSNSALIFSLAGASPTPTSPSSQVQTVFITTGGNGAASTVTSFINTAANASPGLAGDRDSSAMTTSMPKSTTYLTVSAGAGQSRSFTTITAAGASTPTTASATAKPSLVKNSGSSIGVERCWLLLSGSGLVGVLVSMLLL